MSSSSDQDRQTGCCEFQDNLTILRQISFFSGLPIELLKVFAYLCTREVLKSGQYLFRQDDADDCGYYIISGGLDLLRVEDGTEFTLKTINAGNFIGVLSLLGTLPRLYSLRAKETVTCLVITREKFLKAVERFPEIMPKLIQGIANRIALWDKKTVLARKGHWRENDEQVGISLI